MPGKAAPYCGLPGPMPPGPALRLPEEQLEASVLGRSEARLASSLSRSPLTQKTPRPGLWELRTALPWLRSDCSVGGSSSRGPRLRHGRRTVTGPHHPSEGPSEAPSHPCTALGLRWLWTCEFSAFIYCGRPLAPQNRGSLTCPQHHQALRRPKSQPGLAEPRRHSALGQLCSGDGQDSALNEPALAGTTPPTWMVVALPGSSVVTPRTAKVTGLSQLGQVFGLQ